MPVIAIVGAAAAWGLGGATAIGAVIGGTATLATALTAVATVGATLGAIGAVTGDKTLSTIGTVMGAVGGIGSLAAGAGLLGEGATTESLFGAAPSVHAADIASDAAGDIGDLSKLGALPVLPDAANGTLNGAVSATGGTTGLDTVTQAASGDANSLINGGGGANGSRDLVSDSVTDWNNQLVKGAGGALPDGTTAPTAPASATSTAPADTTIAAGNDATTAGLPAKGSYVGETATAGDGTAVSWNGSSWAKQAGIFDGLMKSPMAQFGAIQAAGSFLSGAFDPLKPAQVDALNAQAAANRAATAQTTQQVTNMQGNLPTATRTPQVNPLTGMSTGGGMINSAPVTGQVAV